jgi:hypothetical protein
MRCPVCDQLHHEHSLACKQEATASLEQRYETILRLPLESADAQRLQECEHNILASKKRQLKITTRLEVHKALAHSA